MCSVVQTSKIATADTDAGHVGRIPFITRDRNLQTFLSTINIVSSVILALFVLTVFTVVCIIPCIRRKYERQRRENLHRDEERIRQERILAEQEMRIIQEESILAALPSKMFSKDGELDNGQFCPICLEVFDVGVEISWSRNTKCVHVFHKMCIKTWLLNRLLTHGEQLCPMCRCDFFAEQVEKINDESAT